jgi:hypothetical protein
VIIKGKSVGGGKRLAVHLMRTDTNERAEVREITGVVAENLRGALLEMQAVASGTRTTKPFYHASINTRADEKLTDEQRAHAINRLEEKLGLSGQPRVVVVHEKEGREHCHIVWSRIDINRMAAISDSHNYRKHEEVARDLEREFGHQRVQGAHAEREGKQRPDRTPSHEEMLQVDRGAVSPDQAKALVTDLWRRTDSGRSFKAALEKNNWILARGDRRDFVVIDPNGGTHSLARRVEGAKAKDIRARMADVNPELLPSVAEARAVQRQREADRQLAEREAARAAEARESEAKKKDTSGSLEWTDRGGMVAQQQSANKALRRAARVTPKATPNNAPAATRPKQQKTNKPNAPTGRPLTANEVAASASDPALRQRYLKEEQQREDQKKAAAPTPATNVAAQGNAQTGPPRKYEKFVRDYRGGKLTRDRDDDDRGRDRDNSRSGGRGGRRRSR